VLLLLLLLPTWVSHEADVDAGQQQSSHICAKLAALVVV
jgi:hypothetical protein